MTLLKFNRCWNMNFFLVTCTDGQVDRHKSMHKAHCSWAQVASKQYDNFDGLCGNHILPGYSRAIFRSICNGCFTEDMHYSAALFQKHTIMLQILQHFL